MMSANSSLNWLFANDYNVRNPDIIPSNPGDKKHNTTKEPVPKVKAYATHGNKVLATGLLGGSLALVLAVFTILPFIFTANFVEDPQPAEARMTRGYEKALPVSTHKLNQGSAASSQAPMLGGDDGSSTDYHDLYRTNIPSRFQPASNRRYL